MSLLLMHLCCRARYSTLQHAMPHVMWRTVLHSTDNAVNHNHVTSCSTTGRIASTINVAKQNRIDIAEVTAITMGKSTFIALISSRYRQPHTYSQIVCTLSK